MGQGRSAKQPGASLREGFTTGSAAAAAAAGAVHMLCGGRHPRHVRTPLPPFDQDEHGPAAALDVRIASGGRDASGLAWAEVVKDGGDDPDATHGMAIRAYASEYPFHTRSLAPALLRPACPDSPVPLLGGPVPINVRSRQVFLYAGKGIGTVTLPGLPVVVGEPAINPEPRKQIARAVAQAARQEGFSGALHILLVAEEGETRALRTLNRRLGVVGGISILGTRGIVRPYSNASWKAAIAQAMDVAGALGLKHVLLSTGRRSERLGFGLYPGLPAQSGIQVADFAAFSLREAATRPFDTLAWLCFPGKLLKLAQGLEYTHAREAPADMELLFRLCKHHGGGAELLGQIKGVPTAAGIFARMRDLGGRELHDAVLRRLAEKAREVMTHWLEDAKPDWSSSNQLALHVFSVEDESELLRLEHRP